MIVLAKKWTKISGLIKWNPNIKKIIFYDDFVELKEKLNKNLEVN